MLVTRIFSFSCNVVLPYPGQTHYLSHISVSTIEDFNFCCQGLPKQFMSATLCKLSISRKIKSVTGQRNQNYYQIFFKYFNPKMKSNRSGVLLPNIIH